MIEAIPKERVADVWREARAALEPALAITQECTAHDVLINLVAGRADLWHLHTPGDAWMVVEVATLAHWRAATLSLCGGRFPFADADALRAAWAEYARSHDCRELRMRGRRGWRRWLPEFTEHMLLTYRLPAEGLS